VASAKENGNFCEDYAKRIIPGLEWIDGTYDALLDGHIPVDVKGCEAWIGRSDRDGKRRAGQIKLRYDQNKEIAEGHGLYFCIVHIGQLVVDYFFVRAEMIDYPNDVRKSVTWTTMRDIAEAC